MLEPMTHVHRSSSLLLVFLLTTLLGGTSEVVAGKRGVPNEGALRDRVNKMWKAHAVDDWRTFYDLTCPDFRRCYSRDEFTQDSGIPDDSVVTSWKILKVARATPFAEPLMSDCTDQPLRFESAALVTLRVVGQGENGEPGEPDRWFDGWLYINGTWYWHSGGFTADVAW